MKGIRRDDCFPLGWSEPGNVGDIKERIEFLESDRHELEFLLHCIQAMWP